MGSYSFWAFVGIFGPFLTVCGCSCHYNPWFGHFALKFRGGGCSASVKMYVNLFSAEIFSELGCVFVFLQPVLIFGNCTFLWLSVFQHKYTVLMWFSPSPFFEPSHFLRFEFRMLFSGCSSPTRSSRSWRFGYFSTCFWVFLTGRLPAYFRFWSFFRHFEPSYTCFSRA